MYSIYLIKVRETLFRYKDNPNVLFLHTSARRAPLFPRVRVRLIPFPYPIS